MPQPRVLEPVYWLIVRQDTDWQEALTIGLGDGKEALPVFSWAEEAEMFLRLGDLARSGWRIVESTAGDLASMLAEDPYAEVGFVALDPFPEMVNAALGGMIVLVSLSRQSFLNHLARKKWGPRLVSRTGEASHRQEPYPGEGVDAPLRWLPPGYFLDRSDPELLILRRPDGSFVAAFSARGATREGIRQAAEADARHRLHTSTHSRPSTTATG